MRHDSEKERRKRLQNNPYYQRRMKQYGLRKRSQWEIWLTRVFWVFIAVVITLAIGYLIFTTPIQQHPPI